MMRSLFVVFAVGALLVLAVVLYWRWRDRRQNAEWEARVNAEAEEEVRNTRHANVKAALEAIRSEDDAFSYVLFEDFLYALYGEAHTARGKGTIEQLAAYFAPEARARLASSSGAERPREVSTIVIGGMRVESIETEQRCVRLEVVFTSNMTETDAAGAQQAYYVEERWTLVREAAARSREPARARAIGCPSCGAPLDKTVAAKCGYCGATPKGGEQDWFVVDIDVLSREARAPMLTGTTEEVGTDWPTVVAPDARKELEALRERDPAFSWPAFVQRVERVFHAFHRSWSAQDLQGVRPYLSDNLFELQQYWVRAYKAQGLRNLTENPTVVTVHLARITRDKFFEAVTVRVFASCVDYTVDRNGEVVGGDRSKTREYSEYWTFIRGVGKTGAPRSDGNCPSCGAPLTDVNMAGHCGHCNAKVTSGEFDWVLSRIEQDEVYDAAA
jgi:hypothetical protein